MLLFILIPLVIFVGLPLVVVLISTTLASSAQQLADRQPEKASVYPTAQWLERSYQPEPDGVWPPPPEPPQA